MARRRIIWTPYIVQKRITEGRGQGEYNNYVPWLFVQSFPSRGRVHRIFGWKTNRVHHLFSDLERKVFLHYQWPHSVIDLREQFPLLPLEETVEIAKDIGVRHPTDPHTKYPIVMTTDLLLTVEQCQKADFHPRTVKYINDLENPRTLEKLEIERRFWSSTPRNSVLKIMTEKGVSEPFVLNMNWILSHYWINDLYPLTENEITRISAVLTRLITNELLPLRNVTQNCDRLLRLKGGTSMAVVRHLLANRQWEVDMKTRIRTNEPLVLLNSPSMLINRGGRLVA